MAKFRKVSTSMWGDQKFRRLSKPQPNGQSLWQWLLTGPRATQIPGVILGRLDALAAELEWPSKAFREAFGEVFREGMAKVDQEAGFVFLPNALKHNKPESPNVVRSWRSTWDDVPECALKAEAWRTLKALCEAFGEGFGKAFGEACRQPSPNQEQEQEQEQEQDTDALPREERAPVQGKLLSVPSAPRFDFESLYRRYPRKRGKQPGMDACEKLIRTPADFETLSAGVDAYVAEVQRLRIPEDKRPYWSTFVNEGQWRELAEVAASRPPVRLSLEDAIAAGECK